MTSIFHSNLNSGDKNYAIYVSEKKK